MTPWTVAYHAPSMGFSRQEYWSGLPFPSAENLPNPGIEPGSPALQADSLLFELQGRPLLAFYSGALLELGSADTKKLIFASLCSKSVQFFDLVSH